MPFSIEELSLFAAGATPLERFRERVIEVLVNEPPQLSKNVDGSLSATFSLMADWSTYLEMVTDPKDPSFGESEARRLAGAMCAILAQVQDDDSRNDVVVLARWAPRTIDMIRKHCSGELPRDGFERFVARRPWSDQQREAVCGLAMYELSRFADALERNDFVSLVKLLEG
jgi:hypothetical protein